MEVPFYSLQPTHAALENELIAAVKEVIESNHYVLGKPLAEFEEKFSMYCQSNHTIGVGNGLDALKIALLALDIGPGDEVIVPSNTYIASWLAVSAVGATPIPVEPKLSTMNINEGVIEAQITSKTKAIMPVHLYGLSCEMDSILALANKYNLSVIEDFAQAHGAKYRGRPCGSFGNINGTSFYPSKNLGALGDGGAITTNSSKLQKRCKLLRNYGSTVKYENKEIGLNSRLDTMQAKVLSLKLNHLENWNAERKKLAALYLSCLEQVEELKLPTCPDEMDHVYHLFVVQCQRRDPLMSHLKDKGVSTLIHYPIPPHLQKAYKHLGYEIGSFPLAEQLAETSLSLPIYPGMNSSAVEYVCKQINEFFS